MNLRKLSTHRTTRNRIAWIFSRPSECVHSRQRRHGDLTTIVASFTRSFRNRIMSVDNNRSSVNSPEGRKYANLNAPISQFARHRLDRYLIVYVRSVFDGSICIGIRFLSTRCSDLDNVDSGNYFILTDWSMHANNTLAYTSCGPTYLIRARLESFIIYLYPRRYT